MTDENEKVDVTTRGKLYRGDKVTNGDGTEEIVYTELPGDVTVHRAEDTA